MDRALVAALSFSLVNGGVGRDWTFFCVVAAGEEEEVEKVEGTRSVLVMFNAEEAVALVDGKREASPVLPLEA